MSSKEQAIPERFYVKKMKLPDWLRELWSQNSRIKTVKLLEITELICCFYGCLPICKISTS